MRYYKVKVQLGHVGAGNELESWVYVYGKNAYEAMKYAQSIPAVKHGKIPKLIQISKEEYEEGIKEKDYYNKMNLINEL